MNTRGLWYDFCKTYCNDDFSGADINSAPTVIKLAVDLLVAFSDNKTTGVNSKSVNDVIVESYAPDMLPKEILELLSLKRKMTW